MSANRHPQSMRLCTFSSCVASTFSLGFGIVSGTFEPVGAVFALDEGEDSVCFGAEVVCLLTLTSGTGVKLRAWQTPAPGPRYGAVARIFASTLLIALAGTPTMGEIIRFGAGGSR